MDRTCINCQHFRQGSIGPTRPEYVWGDCLKAREHAWGEGDAGKSVNFAWADGSCDDFEPKLRLTSDDGERTDYQ